MTTIKQMVRKVLRENEDTRNSDKLLYLKVLEAMGFIKEWNYWGDGKAKYLLNSDDVERMPSYESIRRRRQEFNERGQLLPTDAEVLLKRRLYYDLCPYEVLLGEHLSDEILKSVCARCPMRGTAECHHPPEEEGLSAVRVKYKMT